MMNFIETVQNTTVQENQAAVFWLGQAGFLIKTAAGKQIAIDPFFSDCVFRLEKLVGFKRLMPAPCDAKDLALDVLLISHEHNDHFDIDAIGDLIRPQTAVYTNSIVAAKLLEMGFAKAQVHVLQKETPVVLDEFTLLPVDCDHGALAPEALGFILDFGFSKLYYAGDTSLTLDRLQTPIKLQPEVAILPINGAFGNLDSELAAQYAGMLHCKTCIPCHFWTFPLHHGDPQIIIDRIGETAPDCQLKMLCQGEYYLMTK